MEITYLPDANGAKPVTLSPALLVIACDPRALEGLIDYTPWEKDLFAALSNFMFFTFSLRVYPKQVQERVVILDPTVSAEMVGAVHGYRNETAKQWGLQVANKTFHAGGSNIVTTYQIVGPGSTPSQAELLAKLDAFMQNPPSWWPFEAGRYEAVHVEEKQEGPGHLAVNPLLTPYFDHFSGSDLDKGLPWQWLDRQGQNGTIYVHASTCFESVLHCWSYQRLLFDDNRQNRLPTAKDDLIVVIGAGVSGLLFAHHAISHGYTNVSLLEKTNRFAGKTHSLQVPDNGATTICELGTCYLSPAYDEMASALSEFAEGNRRIPIAHGAERGIVVHKANQLTVIDFPDYGLLRACEWLGVPFNDIGKGVAIGAIGIAVGNYLRLRHDIFGSWDGVLPAEQPLGDPYKVFTKTFAEFLDDHEMGVLKGYMEYAYQVQGYGALDKISAYYGLLWITPDIADPLGKDSGVTGYEKGWEDVWEQMASKLKMGIKLEVTVTRIHRGAVVEQPDQAEQPIAPLV